MGMVFVGLWGEISSTETMCHAFRVYFASSIWGELPILDPRGFESELAGEESDGDEGFDGDEDFGSDSNSHNADDDVYSYHSDSSYGFESTGFEDSN